jgi:hypothetical protein
MKNNLIILISAIILSISLIFCVVYISDTINKVNLKEISDIKASQSLLMNSDQAAEYIGISVDTLISNIKRERVEKYSLTTYDTYRFIPYLEIEDVIYFTKGELEKWAEYRTRNH